MGLTDLRQQEVLLLEAVEESVEVWPSKVSHRAQSSEQTLARDLLEMTLTDVLHWKEDMLSCINCVCVCVCMHSRVYTQALTNMVVLRSNLSKNWVMKMWISTRFFVSFSSTSRMMSVSHSNWCWVRVTQMK